MTGHVPETGELFLRDYLYVDHGRVRSLLAQLHEGAPEQVSVSEEKHRKWSAALGSALGLTGERSTSRGEVATRTLADLHFALFEDAAEQTGFLRDISDYASRAKNWNRSKLHRGLTEGDIIRATAPTRVVDPRHVAEQFRRLDDTFGDGAASVRGSMSAAQIQAMLEALYGPGVVVRAFPAGVDEPQCHLAGTLLEAPGYLETERATLFSRHGVALQQWTIVGQVARLPSDQSGQPDTSAFESLGDEMMNSSGSLNRSKLEEMLVKMTEFLEAFGMAEAPQHPAISITPLAVYRTVVPSNDELT